MEVKSIFVEAREWFDKTYGNSYFSARVSVNGEVVGFLPFQYGYETAYQYAAAKWLLENGYTTERVDPLWKLKQNGVDVYSVKYSSGYRDAKRFGLDWRSAA